MLSAEFRRGPAPDGLIQHGTPHRGVSVVAFCAGRRDNPPVMKRIVVLWLAVTASLWSAEPVVSWEEVS